VLKRDRGRVEKKETYRTQTYWQEMESFGQPEIKPRRTEERKIRKPG